MSDRISQPCIVVTNSLHSTDNPPPKVVQGYKVGFQLPHVNFFLSGIKFNIFYPDLIDKSKAPTYKIVKEPGNDETVLLHFSAGPPYEDLAFRIVNREWEFSHKRFVGSFNRFFTNFLHNCPSVALEVASIADVCRFGSTSVVM